LHGVLQTVHFPRAEFWFHPRRSRPRTKRGGAYTLGGGKGSRTGSGRIFAKIAFKV
jgi:hypothetical protein